MTADPPAVRAVVVGVGRFTEDGPWQPLSFVPGLVLEAGDAFAAYLGSPERVSRINDPAAEQLEAALRAAIDDPAGGPFSPEPATP